MSEVNFFCLGRGLVCFLNSVLIWPKSEAFLLVVTSLSSCSIICSAAHMASRSVEMVRWSSGPASWRVLRPAWGGVMSDGWEILSKYFSHLEDCCFVCGGLGSSLHLLLLLESPEVILNEEGCIELSHSDVVIN